MPIVSSILKFDNKSSGPCSPYISMKTLIVWSFVISVVKSVFGITSPRENETLEKDTKDKANVSYR